MYTPKSNYLLLLSLLIGFSACKKDKVDKNETPQLQVGCIPPSLTNGVIAYYPFSNGSLSDASAFNNTLSNSTTASPTSDRDGNTDCAFLFDNLPASGEQLTMANPAFLDGLTKMTLAFWYQPLDTSRVGGNFETLVSRDWGFRCPDTDGQWSVGLYDCRRAVYGRNNSIWDKEIANGSCQDEIIARTDTWHHLAVTYHDGIASLRLYRDGVLQASEKDSIVCNTSNPIQDIGNLFIGSNFTGKIDDMIFYNRVLTSSEVTSLSQLGTCCEGS